MPKALSRARRLLSRAGRMLRDDPACVSQCCDGGGNPCCFEEIPGRPETRHNCGALVAGQCWRGCVQSIQGSFSRTTATQQYTRTTINQVVTVTHLAAAIRILAGDDSQAFQCVYREEIGEGSFTSSDSASAASRASATSTACSGGTGCGTGVLVPMGAGTEGTSLATIRRTVIQGNPLNEGQPACSGFPQVTEEREPDGYRTVDEWCEPTIVQCWPLGQFTANTPGGFDVAIRGIITMPPRANIPVRPYPISTTTPVAPGTFTDVTAPNIYGGSTRTVISVTRSGQSTVTGTGRQVFTGGEVAAQYFAEDSTAVVVDTAEFEETFEYIGYNFPDIGQGTLVRRSTREVRTASRTDTNTSIVTQYSLGWDIGCDGSPGPTGCPPSVQCQDLPSDLRYIIGKPCGGGDHPMFLLPVENVRGCGHVAYNGWCYLFEPSGQRTNSPAGGFVGNDLVDGSSNTSCCECMSRISSACTSVPVPSYPEWRNGLRLGNGLWTTYPPTPSPGACCCSENDRFRLVRASAREVDQFDDNGQELVVFETRLLPNVFPGSGRTDPFSGFRRVPLPGEPTELGWTIEEESFFEGNSLGVSQRLGTAGREPIGCEWDWALFRSPFNIGLGSLFVFFPVPRAVDADQNGGVANGVRLLRYNLFANCTSLFAQVEAERLETGTGRRIQTYAGLIEWVIEKAPSGPCEGECSSLSGVTAVQPHSLLDVLAIAGGV